MPSSPRTLDNWGACAINLLGFGTVTGLFVVQDWVMDVARVGWQDADSLRVSVLGWETGPVPGDEDAAAIHLACRDDSGAVIAAVSFMLHPCPEQPQERAVYLWGMAVSPVWQLRGIGSQLLAAVMSEAQCIDATIVWVDARETAVSFYEQAGAVATGAAYNDEVTNLPDRRIILTV